MPHTHRFLRACLRQPVDRTPIWIMRQAGRYLPEYRATRARAGDFLTLCKTPELATEVTLQPLRRFPLDAAILFSDILVVPEAMGMGVHFSQGEGPVLADPIRREADLERLAEVDPEHRLDYVMSAIRHIRQALEDRVPLIGFSGSPWTLATYMVEGGSSKDFARIKGMLYDAPELMERLLNLLADGVAAYLNAQIRHGVQAVQIFDTWGGVLGPRDFLLFSLASITRIVERLDRVGPDGKPVPVIVFAKGCGVHLEAMASCGCDVLGVDWTTEIGSARRRVGHRVALQGNMDPAVLHARVDRVRDEAVGILEAFGPHDGHIFNLGHGITPDIDPEKVAALVETVHKESMRTRSEGR